MSAKYAWIITHVNVAEIGDDCADEKGTAGPRNASPELLKVARSSDALTFRLLDGDGIWYYRGRIAFAEDGVKPEAVTSKYHSGYICGGNVPEEGFGPLEDWGTPNAGCTEIQYRCADPDDIHAAVWASL